MRLAWGVLSLTISLLLVLDLLLGLFPSEHERLRAVRERAALSLATQVRVMLSQPRADVQLSAVLDGIAQQSDEITSIGVRRRDGLLVAASAEHERSWVPRPDQRSTLDAIVVPLQEPGGTWGALELAYKADPLVTGWRGWIGGTMLALIASLSTDHYPEFGAKIGRNKLFRHHTEAFSFFRYPAPCRSLVHNHFHFRTQLHSGRRENDAANAIAQGDFQTALRKINHGLFAQFTLCG